MTDRIPAPIASTVEPAVRTIVRCGCGYETTTDAADIDLWWRTQQEHACPKVSLARTVGVIA